MKKQDELNIKNLLELRSKSYSVTNQILELQEQKFKTLIDFLEYEEAYTKDKETASRIKILLKLLQIWN